MSAGTPSHSSGTSNPNTGSVRNGTECSAPLSAAFSSARVWRMLMRLPTPNAPARPAGIHQPARRLVPQHLRAQQVRVHERPVHHERRAEAGAERDLRLDAQADLGAGDLARVARDEVIHRLFGRQPRDRRHHARGVARQEDDVLRMSRHLLRQRVADERERVGAAGVLGDRRVVQVEPARERVERHVLEDRPEAPRGRVDLAARRQVTDG